MGVKAYIVLFLSFVGGLFAATVIVEMVEKIDGGEGPTWSALKLMGPQTWLPIYGDPTNLTTALAILVFSCLYCLSCCALFRAARRRNPYLVLPWVLCELSTTIYQACAAVNVKDRFTNSDELLLILDTLLGLAAVCYVLLTTKSWKLRESSTRSHRVSGSDAEAKILHTYVAPEARPLIKARQRVSEIAPKPWIPVESSLLENRKNARDRRARLQTSERRPTKVRRLAQQTLDNGRASTLSENSSDTEDTAVPSCTGGDWLVKYVKPSATLQKTVTRFRRRYCKLSANSSASEGNDINGQSTAVDSGHSPCNESALPGEDNSMTGGLQLESCSRLSLPNRMNCENGSRFRVKKVQAEENTDILEYPEEPIYASVREIRGEEPVSEVSLPEDGRESDSFITADSGSGGVASQDTEASRDRSSPLNRTPPWDHRPGNIWTTDVYEDKRRLLLSGGQGLGYMYSASDMDLIVFAQGGSTYQRIEAPVGTSARDSGGAVYERTLPPGMQMMHRQSWEGSMTNMTPIRFINGVPGYVSYWLTCQSVASSISQSTSDFLEEHAHRQGSPIQYSRAIPTGAAVDRPCGADNEVECSRCGCRWDMRTLFL